MTRCTHTKDCGGVVVGCKLRAGHDDPESGGPDFLHELACYICAGQIPDDWPEPGMRCVKHGTREPGVSS